jgi:predicted transposase/invertase (TIGR01784 family)
VLEKIITLLNSVIALTITDFEMFPGNDLILSRYRLKENNDLTDYSDDIELIFVELPKFKKTLDNLDTLIDKWLYFLKSANQLESVPPNLGDVAAIDHAFTVAKQSKLSRKELEVLENREMFLHDNRNAILKARQDGEIKGRQEGRQEERLEIARSLLDLLDVDTIAQKTGLSISQVQQLR